MRAPAALSLALSLAACSSSRSDTAPGTIVIDEGLDPSLDAAHVTRVILRARQGDGSERPVYDGALPADRRIPLGEVSTSTPVAFVIEGRDDAGDVVARGGTPFVFPAGDMPVLVGAVGQATRLSRPLASPATRSTLVGARYLFSTSELRGTLYDLSRLDTLADPRGLPRPAQTLLSWRDLAVMIDEAGASSIDTTTGASGVNSLGGAAVADVLGGAVVVGTDATYLAGPARASGAKTSTIVRFADAISTVSLSTPRRGAAAGWIDGTGLVVTSGDVDGPVEIVEAGATAPTAGSFALPARRGGVLAGLGEGAFVLLGGVDPSTGAPAPTLRVSLSCVTDCASASAAPIDLAWGRAHAAGPGRSFVVGARASGETRAYLVDATGEREIALKITRTGGDSVAVGDGLVVIAGGVDAAGAPVLTLEQLTP
ncbi:MAG: hypothetical protein IT374_18125 [Polyangiaceae bacterium]|nr:hypothetical protein [Polyangiaceae bacterium]